MTVGQAEAGVDPRVGTTAAGKYKILRLLGRGGMGSVYEAQNLAIGKKVALKFVLVDRSADASALARFHREARAISAVESAHIVQIFDSGETEAGEPFLVMEMLHGEDLGARLARGRLPVNEALAIAVQALRGLRRAHAAGIVHRDLKPENLFLVKDEDDRTQVKIVDFGLSKMMSEAPGLGVSSLTQAGAMVGTPLYMSPEQIEAMPDIDARTDLWALGAILYQAIAGAPPFDEPSYARLVISICQRDPQPLESRAPGVPPALSAVIARALCRDRARRFQTADELLAALIPLLSEAEAARAAAPSLSGVEPSRVSSPAVSTPVPSAPTPARPPSDDAAKGSPGAELRTFTAGAATLWVSQAPTFSIWRGEVAAPDRLRIEARDGNVHELRLAPVGKLNLGRAERVGDEHNELVYADVASRLAATLRHDGVRWWIKRRDECSVPVQVGPRALNRGEEAPLVHGTFVSVGGMRATLVDRRYVTPSVPAGTVDPVTGLLGRAGLEQEIASFLQRQRPGGLILLRPRAGAATPPPATAPRTLAEHPPAVGAAVSIHKAWPSQVIGNHDGTTLLLAAGDGAAVSETARAVAEAARQAGLQSFACGTWLLTGDGLDAGREIELALHAIESLASTDPGLSGGPAAKGGVVSLRELGQGARLASQSELLNASADARRATLLFGIEDQSALSSVGASIIAALEKELTAVVASHAGSGALVAPLAPGVVVASITKKSDPTALGSNVQCDWHARPPIMDGKAELPRTLSWEILHAADPATRAAELSRECADTHGVLSALSGGLPYPIAGRVNAAVSASSAIERVKMLFDVLEGTWRFMAAVLVSASFARRPSPDGTPAGFDAMLDLYRRLGTREGYALGTWRELARTAAKSFDVKGDPIDALAREVLEVKLGSNQTFETLSNLMQVERNGFAHGHYNEARAAADLPEFEQMTRTLLRALRPLAAWTLVTVEKTEPDLYGEVQTVEFIDHTGPFNTGTRRRIGLNSPVRLANVVYLARWREGLVLPLEPLMRRIAHEDKFDLYWMDHLPKAGNCQMSSVVGATQLKVPIDARRLPPLMRALLERGQG
ncbi:MAG: serine/threonine-protein kinase [Byssovorax sp.]